MCFIGVLTQTLRASNPNRNLYYFLIQSLGRVLILLRIFCNMVISSILFTIIFFLSLILKLGGVPFHYWYLKLIQKLNWKLIWLLSIWQKLIPLLLLRISRIKGFLVFGVFRILVRSISTWSQKKIKKILGLSSIFSLGWVLTSFTINNNIWLIFIRGYGLSLLVLVTILSKINYFYSTKKDYPQDPLFLRVFIIGILILRGIPPFIGFFLKLFILMFLIKTYFWISLRILILRLYLIYIYLIIIFFILTYVKPAFLLNINQNKLIFREMILFNFFIRIFILNLLFCLRLHK